MNIKAFRGPLLLLLASFIWGTAFVAQSMGNSVGAFTFTASRSFVGALVLLPMILIVDKTRKKMGAEQPRNDNKIFITGGILCGLALFAGSSLQQIGLKYTTAGKAGFLTALYIVIVPVLGIFLKKRVGLKIWISVATAAAGTYLLSVKEGFSIGTGDVYVIICAVMFSAHILLVGRYSPRTDAIKLSAMQFFVCGVISVVIALIFEKPQIGEILSAWGPILYAGVISSGVAYTLQVISQRDTPPAVASLIMSLESVFAALAGWVVLGETLATQEMVGCALVFGAVILAQIPLLKRKK